MPAPAGAILRYLYVGSSDVGRDAGLYTGPLGGRLLWDIRAFGTRVAAVDVGGAVPLLLAGHRPAGSCLPVFSVPSLRRAETSLRAVGHEPHAEPFEIPNGPGRLFRDASGLEFAVFEDVRPEAMRQLAEGGRGAS